jgi:hypothetical protein
MVRNDEDSVPFLATLPRLGGVYSNSRFGASRPLESNPFCVAPTHPRSVIKHNTSALKHNPIYVESQKCFLRKPQVQEKTLGERNTFRKGGLRNCSWCFLLARTIRIKLSQFSI